MISRRVVQSKHRDILEFSFGCVSKEDDFGFDLQPAGHILVEVTSRWFTVSNLIVHIFSLTCLSNAVMAEQENNGMAGKTVASPKDMTSDATQNPPGPSTLPENLDLQTTLLTLNSQMSTMAEILSQRCMNSSDGQGRKCSRPKRRHGTATTDSSSDNDSDDEPTKKQKNRAL